MRKLHLDLDCLKVETFVTASAPGGERGTVRGHGQAIPTVIDVTGWSLENHTMDCPTAFCVSDFCGSDDPNTRYRISEACGDWTDQQQNFG